mmetsp:Transcript_56735/g.184640  ORF Transcript_56735/g.184640 Transcript_56735/m.184640 type:complete len:255 (-) Transcript_56735:710-1474(-)
MRSQVSCNLGIHIEEATLAAMMPRITTKVRPLGTSTQPEKTSLSPMSTRIAEMPYLSIWKVLVKDSMMKYSDLKLNMAKAEDEQFKKTSLTEANLDATESTANTKSTTHTAMTTRSNKEALRFKRAGFLMTPATSKSALPCRAGHSPPGGPLELEPPFLLGSSRLSASFLLGSNRLLPSKDSRRGNPPDIGSIVVGASTPEPMPSIANAAPLGPRKELPSKTDISSSQLPTLAERTGGLHSTSATVMKKWPCGS